MNLETINRAARTAAKATADLRAAVAEAHKAEAANITELAKAAGVGRQTIYRWIDLEGGTLRTTRNRK